MFRIAGIFFLIVFIIVLGVSAGVVAGYMGNLPKLTSYQSFNPDQTSKVYAADGTLLATLHAEQNREVIPIDQIPLNLQRAIIAIEDERFYQHRGVDLKAILRAIYTNLRYGAIVEGGSTITQQYVRNSFIKPEKTLLRKIKEAALAYQLERKYSKKKILEFYLNTVYFGQGCYGVETASQTFFGKPAKALTLAESALLAGLPGAPNLYSPYINPKLALKRRNIVLNKMVKLKYITKAEAEQAKKEPLKLKPLKTEKDVIAPYFVEYVKLSLIDKYGANMVYRGGLRIYTTIDLKMQQQAKEAVFSTLTDPDDPEAALVSIEPKTGYIKAMVGGRDFKSNKFNLATQAKRSPGSAFKPFVLVAALEEGISPSRTYNASSPRTIKVPYGTWEVENYEGKTFSGYMSIREATVWSVNVVYAQLIMDVGPAKVAEIAHKMGITSPVPPYPAIAIGGLEEGVSPLEMASAYATLANDGVYIKPTAILKVTDAQGNTIEKSKALGKQVISKKVARAATEILQSVISRGTGFRANIDRPAAGKTGTSEYKQDAWFVGYTPDLSTAVWIGYPSASISMDWIHGYPPYGGAIPAIIWRKFMSKALEGKPITNFPGAEEIEESYVKVTICTESGLLATSYCPETTTKWFKKGSEPTEYCNIHQEEEEEETAERISVPNVIGLSVNEAREALAALGLNVGVTYETNNQVPQDQVISQTPQAGTYVEAGSTITLVVSSGPPSPPNEEEEPEPPPEGDGEPTP